MLMMARERSSSTTTASLEATDRDVGNNYNHSTLKGNSIIRSYTLGIEEENLNCLISVLYQ